MATSKDVKLRFLLEAVDRAGATLDAVTKKLTDTAQAVTGVGAAAKTAGESATNSFKGMELAAGSLSDRLSNIATTMTEVGEKAMLIGAAMTAAIAAPVKISADFEQAMSQVAAVADDAATNMGVLRNAALEMGRNTRFSAIEAATGMEVLAKAGLNAGQILQALPPVLQLAVVGSMDISAAADVAISAMSGMGKTTADLKEMMDMMALTANATIADVNDLGMAYKYAASFAQVSGIEFNVLNGALGVLHQNGRKATIAGTDIRSMLLSLLDATTDAARTMREMGVEVVRTSSGAVDLIATLKAFRDANLNAEQAAQIFRRGGAASALILTQQADAVENLSLQVLNSSGTLDQMAKVMTDNLLGAIKMSLNALQSLATELGTGFLAPLKNAVNAFTGLINSMSVFARNNKMLVTFVGGTIGALGGLIIVLGATSFAFGKLATAMMFLWKQANIIGILQGARTAIVLLNTPINQLSIGITGLAAKFKMLWAVIMANPWVALATMVAAAAYALTMFQDTLEEQYKTATEARAKIDELGTSVAELTRRTEVADEGTAEWKAANLELKKALEQVTAENTSLSKAASDAAGTIDEFGNRTADSTAKVKDFIAALDAKRVSAAAEQIRLLGEQMREAFEPGWMEHTIRSLQILMGTLKMWTGGKATWGGVIEGDSIKDRLISNFNTVGEYYDQWSKNQQAKTDAFKAKVMELGREWVKNGMAIKDMNDAMLKTKVKEEFPTLGSREVDAAVAGLKMVQDEYLKSQQVITNAANKSASERAGIYEKQFKSETASLSKLSADYERARGAAQLKPDDPATVRQMEATFKALFDAKNKIASSSNEFLKNKQAEYQKLQEEEVAEQERKATIDAKNKEVYEQRIYDIKMKYSKAFAKDNALVLEEMQKAGLGDQDKIFQEQARKVQIANNNAARAERSAADERLKTAYANADKVARAEEETQKLRVSLMEEGRAKIEAEYALDVAAFKRSDDYKVMSAKARNERLLALEQKKNKKLEEEQLKIDKSLNEAQMREAQERMSMELDQIEWLHDQAKIGDDEYLAQKEANIRASYQRQLTYLEWYLAEAKRLGKDEEVRDTETAIVMSKLKLEAQLGDLVRKRVQLQEDAAQRERNAIAAVVQAEKQRLEMIMKIPRWNRIEEAEQMENIIKALNVQLASQAQNLETINKELQPDLWQRTVNEIDSTRLAIVEMEQELQVLRGTIEEGLTRGLQEYVLGQKTAFEQARDFAKNAAQEMQDAFSELFFDAMQGKLKSAMDYWKRFYTTIQKYAADYLASYVMTGANQGKETGGIFGMVMKFFGTSGKKEVSVKEQLNTQTLTAQTQLNSSISSANLTLQSAIAALDRLTTAMNAKVEGGTGGIPAGEFGEGRGSGVPVGEFGEEGGWSPSEVTESLQTGAEGFWTTVQGWFGSIFSSIGSVFSSVWSGIQSGWTNIFSYIQSGFGSVFSSLGNWLSNLFSSSGAGGGMGGFFDMFMSLFSSGAAKGGRITGGSGVKDDVPILGMAGEYILRKAAVEKYGLGFIEAMNRGLIEIPSTLKRLTMPVTVPTKGRFATGGLISDQQPQKQDGSSVQVVNVIDPNLLDQYLASTAGQKTLINVLSKNHYELKRIMRS